ncbi:hypothetical protein ACEWY4_014029 [Coilia grayii]|uniref:DUF4806 domain-containing protein n=1 Tax=Coilia grayii TaxID=363190 RepID=A0ABD1JR87_9TELE
MAYHLIQFQASKDIAVVPVDWQDDGVVYWPRYKNTERVKTAVANCEEHEPNGLQYDVKVVRTCNNNKDAITLQRQYETGCNTSGLQSDAGQEGELPDKRPRRTVGPMCYQSWLTSDYHLIELYSPLVHRPPLHRSGTAVPPQLPPPPAPALNVRQIEEPSNHAATWRGGSIPNNIPWSGEQHLTNTVILSHRFWGQIPQITFSSNNFYISCFSTAVEVHILSLLEHMKQQQDQLVAKVNFLCSGLNCTPGPDSEMPENIQLPLEQLDAVDAFEIFLKEPSNGPARQRVISSLAIIGGQDVKRVTWNILSRLFSDEVSCQISWKGVHNKRPFSRMQDTLLFCK